VKKFKGLFRKRLFRKTDLDKNGVIDFDEFCSMEENSGIDKNRLQILFDKLDINGDGQLDFSEFGAFQAPGKAPSQDMAGSTTLEAAAQKLAPLTQPSSLSPKPQSSYESGATDAAAPPPSCSAGQGMRQHSARPADTLPQQGGSSGSGSGGGGFDVSGLTLAHVVERMDALEERVMMKLISISEALHQQGLRSSWRAAGQREHQLPNDQMNVRHQRIDCHYHEIPPEGLERLQAVPPFPPRLPPPADGPVKMGSNHPATYPALTLQPLASVADAYPRQAREGLGGGGGGGRRRERGRAANTVDVAHTLVSGAPRIHFSPPKGGSRGAEDEEGAGEKASKRVPPWWFHSYYPATDARAAPSPARRPGMDQPSSPATASQAPSRVIFSQRGGGVDCGARRTDCDGAGPAPSEENGNGSPQGIHDVTHEGKAQQASGGPSTDSYLSPHWQVKLRRVADHPT